MDIEDKLEIAQLELLDSSKKVQDELVISTQVNAKLKCYELAIQHVSTMNHSGTMTAFRVNDDIKKEYKNILKIIGIKE